MNPQLTSFAARLRELIDDRPLAIGRPQFSELAMELFALQFKHNPAYRKICEARKLTPKVVSHWTQVPAVPAATFKELELTCIPQKQRTAVFHSSGTMKQKPSRHFHCAKSLAVYESSLWQWFQLNVPPALDSGLATLDLLVLTPAPTQVPHSSLVHMFETVGLNLGEARVPASRPTFFGQLDSDGAWTLDFQATLSALADNTKYKIQNTKLILGTAFSFVHLLDYLMENNLQFRLPKNSRVMETGGYKNRSRVLPKAELHALITERLGVPRENIICEYGMSELSSQAYAESSGAFQFPPWARVQIISPETGREVADGEAGLIRVFDLANVFSVAAIQTEDLGVRHDEHFELVGRAQLAEPRGCSLMTA